MNNSATINPEKRRNCRFIDSIKNWGVCYYVLETLYKIIQMTPFDTYNKYFYVVDIFHRFVLMKTRMLSKNYFINQFSIYTSTIKNANVIKNNNQQYKVFMIIRQFLFILLFNYYMAVPTEYLYIFSKTKKWDNRVLRIF